MTELIKAADMIRTATKLIIVTDYDNDGATSNHISKEYVTRSKRDHVILMSNNEYPRGIHTGMVNDVIKSYVSGSVMVTADTGSDATEACKAIKTACPGIKIIITDHHTIPDEVALLNTVDALVNAQRVGSTINKHWCGANVVWELYKKVGDANLDDLIGFVAFANLIDQMSMADTENRKTYREGVRVLKNYDMIKFGLKHTRDVIPHDRWLSIKFAPILNSCHRFGRPDLAVRIMSGDKSAFDEAVIINTVRKKKTTELYASLKPQIKANQSLLPHIMILATFGIENKPFCGLIASRAVQDLKVPTLVLNITQDGIGGSGRTIGDFKFKQAIDDLHINDIKAMGHQGAFGLYVGDKEAVKSIVDKYIKWAGDNNILYDDGVKTKDLLVRDIRRQAITVDKGRPYGNGNPYPAYSSAAIVSKVKMSRSNISIFEIEDGEGSSIEALYFSALGDVLPGDEIDMVFEIDMDLDIKLIVKSFSISK